MRPPRPLSLPLLLWSAPWARPPRGGGSCDPARRGSGGGRRAAPAASGTRHTGWRRRSSTPAAGRSCWRSPPRSGPGRTGGRQRWRPGGGARTRPSGGAAASVRFAARAPGWGRSRMLPGGMVWQAVRDGAARRMRWGSRQGVVAGGAGRRSVQVGAGRLVRGGHPHPDRCAIRPLPRRAGEVKKDGGCEMRLPWSPQGTGFRTPAGRARVQP